LSAERLQKALARAGVASRRAVEDLIREGRVTVNGRVATLGDKADLEEDAVKVDDKLIQAPAGDHLYFLLHKPPGCVSTRSDPEGRPTVMDCIPHRLRAKLVPVGRLDFETEGLILLTDDGDLAHRIAHPRYGCTKTYEVKVKGEPEPAAVEKLRRGIVLDGKRTAPAEIVAMPASPGPRDPIRNSWWQVVLTEGRTRQIREMFFRIGHPVQKLRRVAIGPLRDDRLPPGDWRELTDHEVEVLRRSTRGDRKGKRKAGDKKPPAGARGRGRGVGKGKGKRPGTGGGRGRAGEDRPKGKGRGAGGGRKTGVGRGRAGESRGKSGGRAGGRHSGGDRTRGGRPGRGRGPKGGKGGGRRG
jgi:23S rRNA pseudouridine2605 synthase